MCFSATASFTVAGLLVPIAAYSLYTAWRTDRRWLGIAAIPAVFAIQQAVEGAIWRGIEAGDAETVALAARGFLFFSHFFWLAWVPLAAYLVEPAGPRRHLIAGLGLVGAAFGASAMLPAVLLDGWLTVAVTDGSIDYQARLIYDEGIERLSLRFVYGAIILGALFLSAWRAIRIFGGLILASAIVAAGIFPEVFVSVWCFFAAVLSVYLAGLLAWRSPARG